MSKPPVLLSEVPWWLKLRMPVRLASEGIRRLVA